MRERYNNERFWKNAARVLLRKPAGYHWPPNPHLSTLPPFSIDFGSAMVGLDMRVTSLARELVESRHDAGKKLLEWEIDRTGQLTAELIGADPEEIYFSTSTTGAMEEALKNLKLRDGAEILTTADEYGTIIGLLELKAQLHHGLVKSVTTNGDVVDSIRRAISPKTGLVVTSHVTHGTGKVLPIGEISDLTRERGVTYIVDAAQSVGHIPFDVRLYNPEMAVFCGHKWLRGQPTSGILYVAKKTGIKPAIFSSFYSQINRMRQPITTPGINCFGESLYENAEIGNDFALAHLGKVLEQHKKLGWEHEYRRIEHLGEIARQVLGQNPYVILSNPENPAPGIIPLRIKNIAEEDMANLLLYKFGIRVTLKPESRLVRVSVSPFNTVDDIHVLDAAIKLIANYHYV